ncbi:hypothetical protein V5299_18365 [Celeribacter halophilus]
MVPLRLFKKSAEFWGQILIVQCTKLFIEGQGNLYSLVTIFSRINGYFVVSFAFVQLASGMISVLISQIKPR